MKFLIAMVAFHLSGSPLFFDELGIQYRVFRACSSAGFILIRAKENKFSHGFKFSLIVRRVILYANIFYARNSFSRMAHEPTIFRSIGKLSQTKLPA